MFDTINTKLTEQLTGQTKDGFLVNEGTPQNLAISIENARQSLEKKEMAGLLPVGAASRLTARLRDQYIGGDIGIVGPPSPFAEGEAVTSGEIAPSAPIEEAEQSDEEEFEALERKFKRIESEKKRGRRFVGLTADEEEIVRQYNAAIRTQFGQKIRRTTSLGAKLKGVIGNKTTEATFGERLGIQR